MKMSWHPHRAKEKFDKSEGHIGIATWTGCCGDLPADGTLAVRWAFSDGQCLTNLGLGEAKREATQFERFGKLFNFVQIDSVHDVCLIDLVDGGLVCAKQIIIWQIKKQLDLIIA